MKKQGVRRRPYSRATVFEKHERAKTDLGVLAYVLLLIRWVIMFTDVIAVERL